MGGARAGSPCIGAGDPLEPLGITAWHAAVVLDLAIPAATLATNAVAMAIE